MREQIQILGDNYLVEKTRGVAYLIHWKRFEKTRTYLFYILKKEERKGLSPESEWWNDHVPQILDNVELGKRIQNTNFRINTKNMTKYRYEGTHIHDFEKILRGPIEIAHFVLILIDIDLSSIFIRVNF